MVVDPVLSDYFDGLLRELFRGWVKEVRGTRLVPLDHVLSFLTWPLFKERILLALLFRQMKHPGEGVSFSHVNTGSGSRHLTFETKQSGPEIVSTRHLMEVAWLWQDFPSFATVRLVNKSLDSLISFTRGHHAITPLLEGLINSNFAEFCLEFEVLGPNALRWTQESLPHRLGKVDQARVISVDIRGELWPDHFIRRIWVGHWRLPHHLHTRCHLRRLLLLHFNLLINQ